MLTHLTIQMSSRSLIFFITILTACLDLVDGLTSSSVCSRRLLLKTGAAFTIATVTKSAVSNALDDVIPMNVGGKPVYGNEDIMSNKAHGTSDAPVQSKLRYGVSNKLADRITNYNRQFAEQAGYFEYTSLEDEIRAQAAKSGGKPIAFYDSVTGKPLFVAPIGRSIDEFLAESKVHGWPSFRDQEVVWDNVRVLRNGETISLTGTHLGHNLPDRLGNRYCINLVSIAGEPTN